MKHKGDYVVEANANLTLKAGDEIHLKPGVHFKAGSTVYITPNYEVCNDLKNGSANVNNSQSNTTSNDENDYNYRTEQNLDSRIVIFPNPTTQNLEIKVLEEKDIVSIAIFDLMGKELFKSYCSSNKTTLNLEFLKDGVYLVKVCISDNSVITKQIQKL